MNNQINPILYVGLPQLEKRLILTVNKKKVSNTKLFEAINSALSISKELICSKGRKNQVVTARYIFIGLQKEIGNFTTLKNTGKILNLHHSTIIYAYHTYKDFIETKDKMFNNSLELVLKELNNETARK